MNINYNINHKLLQLEIFKDLKGHQKRAVLITLSCIAHFDINTKGGCQFYKGQMAQDWDMSIRYFGYATKLLLDKGIITDIKPYDRKTQSGAIYALSIGYRRHYTKLYSSRHKAIDATTRVNNNNNYKPKSDDSSNDSSSSSKWKNTSSDPKAPRDPGPQPKGGTPEHKKWVNDYLIYEQYKLDQK